MSQENREILRRAVAAWERRDLDAMVHDVAADAVTYRPHPDGATFHGPQGFLEAVSTWAQEFKDFDATPEEVIELDDDRILVRVRETGIGERSGAPIEADFWFAYTFDDSKIVRVGMFPSKEQALDDSAAGE